MRIITIYLSLLFVSFFTQQLQAQDENYQKSIIVLKNQKAKITAQEKNELKLEVEEINKRLKKKEITKEEAEELKKEAAKKRALNIDDRLAIIDSKIALIQRNGLNKNESPFENDSTRTALFQENRDFFGLKIGKKSELPKKDKRTTSNLVLGLGFFNNDISGEKFFDTPHSILGSKYFEVGFLWKTRILKKSNWLRFRYGVLYDSGALKTKDDKYFTELDRTSGSQFDFIDSEFGELKKSKVRFDSFVLPFYLEFGPSTKKEYGDYIRYSTRKKLRVGFGFYYRYLLNRIQTARSAEGPFIADVPRLSLNGANQTVGGLSFYAGRGDTLFVFRIEGDFNSLSGGGVGLRNNVSLGLRFEL